MAPTTRAGTKRLRGETTNAGTGAPGPKQQKRSKKGSKLTEDDETAAQLAQPFRFLELSAELRNRIYYFATEDYSTLPLAPCVRHMAAVKPYAERHWKFFALTQVCRQVRAEYRPLWFLDCSVCFEFRQSCRFVEAFLPNTTDLKHAPKLLQMPWAQGFDDTGSYDITHLLRLRAHCPSFRFEFIPDSILYKLGPDNDICSYCFEMLHLEEHGLGSEYNIWDECLCPPMDLDYEEWEFYHYDRMDYMYAICDFVYNETDSWLDDIRENKMTVHCTFARGTDHITFQIHYMEQFCHNTSDFHQAWDLLKNWGILELPRKSQMDFVIVYDEKQTFEDIGYEMTNSVVRKVRVTKAASSQ